MAKDDGGPAFPTDYDVNCEACGAMTREVQPHTGMSLRDYFAAHAPFTAIDVEGWSIADCAKILGIEGKDYNGVVHYKQVVAIMAYRYADAMLAARGA